MGDVNAMVAAAGGAGGVQPHQHPQRPRHRHHQRHLRRRSWLTIVVLCATLLLLLLLTLSLPFAVTPGLAAAPASAAPAAGKAAEPAKKIEPVAKAEPVKRAEPVAKAAPAPVPAPPKKLTEAAKAEPSKAKPVPPTKADAPASAPPKVAPAPPKADPPAPAPAKVDPPAPTPTPTHSTPLDISPFLIGNRFSRGDTIPVLVNTVGPFHNPAEQYKFDSLGFCVPDVGDDDSFSKVLAGDRRRSSFYQLEFHVDKADAELCSVTFNALQVNELVRAIQNNYVFELFVDDLAIKGFVGEMEARVIDERAASDALASGDAAAATLASKAIAYEYYLFPHLEFGVAANGDFIVAANLTTDPLKRVRIEPDKPATVRFTYSVLWSDVDVSYEERAAYHMRSALDDQTVEIHWLSIINSFVLVILLTAFLAVVLVRVLHKDFTRYMEIDYLEEGQEPEEDVGWKLVHGDVFRYPRHVMLLSALVGNGIQIFVLFICLLALALLGRFYPGQRGALYSAVVVLYAFTAFIAGNVSTRMYLSLGGTKWALNSLLTALIFSVPFFFTFCVVNSVAWSYGASTALPAVFVVLIIVLWAVVSIPLTILGSMRARHSVTPFDAPCKTNRVEREIPSSSWFRSTLVHCFIGGFLPFTAIYTEVHYIFVAIYGSRVYTLYGILTITFVMLLLVVGFITVALTYFQLEAEDYRWWWRSFFNGASTGAFFFAYAIFYFWRRSEMSGFLQGTFFFGYMAMVSYAIALMLGALSFYTARGFVRHIYRSIKID